MNMAQSNMDHRLDPIRRWLGPDYNYKKVTGINSELLCEAVAFAKQQIETKHTEFARLSTNLDELACNFDQLQAYEAKLSTNSLYKPNFIQKILDKLRGPSPFEKFQTVVEKIISPVSQQAIDDAKTVLKISIDNNISAWILYLELSDYYSLKYLKDHLKVPSLQHNGDNQSVTYQWLRELARFPHPHQVLLIALILAHEQDMRDKIAGRQNLRIRPETILRTMVFLYHCKPAQVVYSGFNIVGNKPLWSCGNCHGRNALIGKIAAAIPELILNHSNIGKSYTMDHQNLFTLPGNIKQLFVARGRDQLIFFGIGDIINPEDNQRDLAYDASLECMKESRFTFVSNSVIVLARHGDKISACIKKSGELKWLTDLQLHFEMPITKRWNV